MTRFADQEKEASRKGGEDTGAGTQDYTGIEEKDTDVDKKG
jgi:hypothetical protein